MTPIEAGGKARAPAVSVIIPTFQRREYVRRAVESVLAQTYRKFELIVVDDGSTDGTEQALAGLDPRLRYQWQENRGTGAARNAGLRLARGEIAAFLDSDNRWLPHHLALVAGVFERFPQAVLVCTCPRQDIAGREEPHQARLVDCLPLMYCDTSIGLISCVGIDREQLLTVGGFDEHLEALEDREAFLRLAACGPFAFVRNRTVIHQITSRSRHDRAVRSGANLEARETIAKVGLTVARSTRRRDRSDLVERAQGYVHYAAALRALAESDDDAARRNLEEACRLLPELSDQPEVLVRRIVDLGTADSACCFAAAAALWPDQRSDTAVCLRLVAVAAAIRARRPGTAVTLLPGLPLVRVPGFALRNRSALSRLTRRAIRHRRYRTGEPGRAD
jgi:glycosyltransferase involved in cell wall biosynthesis